jgi:hypothetical protein
MDSETLRHCVEMAAYHEVREELWLLYARQREDMIASCRLAVTSSTDPEDARAGDRNLWALENSLNRCKRVAAEHRRMKLLYRAALNSFLSAMDKSIAEDSGVHEDELCAQPVPSPRRSSGNATSPAVSDARAGP